ncbi:alpha/beta fold hydrolase [Streptomyces sp. NPDC059629]|uniref:alpha/beta fold hydrolase n=1 Tax=Streptomyces sp. NPDC059629 TaxID=3346889 RepID=UPI0036794D2C
MAAALPHSRLCEMPGSGHFGHIEEPEAFIDALLDFVRTGQSVGYGEQEGVRA